MDPGTIGIEGAVTKCFSDIIGQEAAVGFLREVVSGAKVSHAYLFTGISGIGKTTSAFAFGRALNCLAPSDGDACGRCVPCRQMAGGNFPDLETVRPEGRVIRIEQVRELTRRIGYKTVSGQYRVSIIEQAGTLTLEAANAFLKTLEEPPPWNILILIARDKKGLLPTIVSRCQKVSFRPVRAELLSQWLHDNCGIPLHTAAVLSRLSEGSVGRALRMAESDELVDRMSNHIQAVLELHSRSPHDVLSTAVEYAKNEKKRAVDPEDNEEEGALIGVLGLWKTCFRDMLLLKHGDLTDLLVLGDHERALRKMSSVYKIDNLVKSLLILDRAQKDISRSRNLELVMETTLMALRKAVEA